MLVLSEFSETVFRELTSLGIILLLQAFKDQKSLCGILITERCGERGVEKHTKNVKLHIVGLQLIEEIEQYETKKQEI